MNSVEKYDIENDEWTEISPMVMKRSNAMLAIANGFLYAFFGKGEDGKYPESIERINIQNDSIWEMILYSNPSNICTKIYGCGLYQIDELIYFLGGKCNEKKTDEVKSEDKSKVIELKMGNAYHVKKDVEIVLKKLIVQVV